MEDITFCRSLSLLWDCFNRHVFDFFEASGLKEVRISCNISTTAARQMLIPKFQNKARYAS